MSCPNCGAHLGVQTFLDEGYVMPPQVETVIPGMFTAKERWTVSRCEGLRPLLLIGYLSPPCGYVWWRHLVSPLPVVVPGRRSLL